LSGQTASSLAVSGLAPGSYSYTVAITNGVAPFGVISSPVVLTVVNPTGYDGAVFASKDKFGVTRPPLAYYPLNETSGTTIFDWAGTHDGTLFGSYQLGQTGPVAGTGALRMFGTNVIDPVTQYQTYSQVVVPYYPELNPEDNGNFTQEFWYNPDDTNITICAVSSQFDVGNNKAGLAMMLGNNNVGIAQTAVNNWTIILGKYNNVNQGVQQNGTGGVTPAVAGQWQHVAGVCDGDDSLVTLYVNGVPEQVNNVGYSIWPGDSSTTGGWNQNYFAPLILGNRYLGQFPMKGRLSEVAIYDYALTYTDITNHSSQVWTPAKFTQNPGNVTTTESLTATVTLTAKALGVPNAYQWYHNGVACDPTVLNLDGTPHYPVIGTVAGDTQGTDGPTLLISQIKTNDAGSYYLKVINPLNVATGGSTNSTT